MGSCYTRRTTLPSPPRHPPANRIRRTQPLGDQPRPKGVYAQPRLPPEQYVGDFDEFPMGLPRVQCSFKICCCCINAGKFETVCHREEPASGPCPLCCRVLPHKAGGETADSKDVGPRARVVLGREGWQVCLKMALCPIALPCRAWNQHKLLTDVYPVESTLSQVRRLCGILGHSHPQIGQIRQIVFPLNDLRSIFRSRCIPHLYDLYDLDDLLIAHAEGKPNNPQFLEHVIWVWIYIITTIQCRLTNEK